MYRTAKCHLRQLIDPNKPPPNSLKKGTGKSGQCLLVTIMLCIIMLCEGSHKVSPKVKNLVPCRKLSFYSHRVVSWAKTGCHFPNYVANISLASSGEYRYMYYNCHVCLFLIFCLFWHICLLLKKSVISITKKKKAAKPEDRIPQPKLKI